MVLWEPHEIHLTVPVGIHPFIDGPIHVLRRIEDGIVGLFVGGSQLKRSQWHRLFFVAKEPDVFFHKLAAVLHGIPHFTERPCHFPIVRRSGLRTFDAEEIAVPTMNVAIEIVSQRLDVGNTFCHRGQGFDFSWHKMNGCLSPYYIALQPHGK